MSMLELMYAWGRGNGRNAKYIPLPVYMSAFTWGRVAGGRTGPRRSHPASTNKVIDCTLILLDAYCLSKKSCLKRLLGHTLFIHFTSKAA